VDSFEDVHTDDFITAVGRVGRRQLRRLDLDPYPTGLLKRGLSKKVVEKGVSSKVLQGMEYTRAVGVMLSHDMANVNKRVDELVEVVERVGHETDELSGISSFCPIKVKIRLVRYMTITKGKSDLLLQKPQRPANTNTILDVNVSLSHYIIYSHGLLKIQKNS
jgi:hypothetical protein